MADLRFDGQVAIVTGAGGGLGRHHALALAERGAHVVVNDVGGDVHGDGTDPGAAETVVAEIRQAGGEAVADTNTVATPEGGEAIVRTALEAYGRVDILVNNAGITRGRAFHNLTADMVDAVLDVHLKGAFFVTRPAWVEFRRQGYGRVINTTSTTGILGTYGHLNYLSAKTGLWGFTRGLAREGADQGIKVNAIAPWARTRMTKDSDQARAKRVKPGDDVVVESGRRVNLDVALVSPLVVVLAHESAPSNGHIYTVGGGRVARYFIATTEGYYDPELTPERILDHFDDVEDTRQFAVYDSAEEELAAFAARVAGA